MAIILKSPAFHLLHAMSQWCCISDVVLLVALAQGRLCKNAKTVNHTWRRLYAVELNQFSIEQWALFMKSFHDKWRFTFERIFNLDLDHWSSCRFLICPSVISGYHWRNHILIWPIVIRMEVESTFSVDHHMVLSLLDYSGNFRLSTWNLFIILDTGAFWLILGV